MLSVAIGMVWSVAYDTRSLRLADDALEKSLRLADADLAGARDAFNDAFERFQWSEVREGSAAARSAVAATARLLRLPYLAVASNGWRPMETKLKTHAKHLRTIAAKGEETV